MSETHEEESPEIRLLDDPKEPVTGGATPDPPPLVQSIPPPRGDGGDDQR